MLTGELLRTSYAGRRVLITGHTGFKGGWLALWLHRLGAEVTGFSLAPATTPSFFEATGLESCCRHNLGDVRNDRALLALIRDVRPDFIFHLAAQPLVRLSYDEPVETIATNVLGTVHLLEGVRSLQLQCVVVIVTTDKCYSNREWVHSYREEDRLGGHDPYSASKACAELVVDAYRRSYFTRPGLAHPRVRVASARAGNVIGGGDWAADRLVPDAVRALAAGLPVQVRNAASVRPWQHVAEALAGYLLLGVRLEGPDARDFCGAWNFGPPPHECHPVGALVSQLVEAWGSGDSQEAPESEPRHEAGLLSLSIDKACLLLGWRPRWDLATALAHTVSWYRAFYADAHPDELRSLVWEQLEAYTAAADGATPT